MRRAFIDLVFVLLLLGLLGIAAAENHSTTIGVLENGECFVRVLPEIVDLGVGYVVGEEFKIAVVFEEVSNVGGFDVRFGWNTTYLDYVDHTLTAPFEDYPDPQFPSPYGGILHPPSLLLRDDVDSDAGTYWAAFATLGGPYFNGSGTAFTMTFQVTNQSDIDVEVLLDIKSAFISGVTMPPLPEIYDGMVRIPRRPHIVPDDHPTIQEAINNASDGDAIFVRNGTYYENVYISKDNVTLRGEDRAATVIDGRGVGTVVKITGDNVSFHGFEVRNCSWGFPFYGILLDHSDNTKITNNIVALNQETGIWVDCSHHNTFINNIITSNKGDGILLRYSHNNTISDNVLSHNAGDGISIFGSDNTTVIGNTVTSNWYGIGITGSTQNTLISNNLTDNIFNLDVVAYSLADFIHEIDTSNTVDGRPIYYLVSKCNETIPTSAGYAAAINSTYITAANLRLTNNGQGVLFAYTHNSLIKGINASDNVYAVWLHSSSNNTLIGNNLSYNNNGMCMHDFCSYNKITSNTIAFNNANGILLVSCRDNTFCLNNLIGNSYSQVEPGAFSNSWDNGYDGNYWSDYSGTDLDGDGIGDTPYIIDGYNQDNYPLMNIYWNPADVNHDLKVDIHDVVLISGAYLSTPSDSRWNPHCDLVEPFGIIDIYDVVLMCGHYGEEYTP